MRKNLLKIQSYQYLMQGILLGLIPLSILAVHAENKLLPQYGAAITAALATLLMLLGIWRLFRNSNFSRLLAITGILLHNFTMFFEYRADPLLTMFSLLISIALIYYLCTAQLHPVNPTPETLQLERFLGVAFSLTALTLFSPLFAHDLELFALAIFLSLTILLYFADKYISLVRRLRFKALLRLLVLIILLGTILLFSADFIVLGGLIIGLISVIFALNIKHADLKYLEVILQHPARCLVLTFFLLCTAGTLLLRTPVAMQEEISVLEAAFTAVSASCVTGLTVIDISKELTLSGRVFLMLIIQLGGLGIMTLTAMALHALGRLSLTGEQLISELASSQEQNIFQNLKMIIIMTFSVELIGAVLLSIGFYNVHHDWAISIELGIFTSVSAFCNAGFFPGSENLVPYAGEKFLLIIVAILIIIGGIAPAVTYTLLKAKNLSKLPFVSKLILGTTAALLLSGTLMLLLFEWNGIFAHLPWHDKLTNAFFQATTLRTAGFNTVTFSALSMPAYMLMLISMFIGGSPGGTAGGIKTTTLAVLALTFRAAVRGEDQVIGFYNRISASTVIKAVAILISAGMVLMLTIFMLTGTQDISPKALVFEAFSALATVGLSLDCTTKLDAVGQIIIMMAMFAGRIGPLTLFLMLNERRNTKIPGYPQTKIPLA